MDKCYFVDSMGGHGALICALKNPGLYKTVSAFAPISNPISCPWGKKAFSGYLGKTETNAWKDWDASELAKKYNGPPLHILIDQVSYLNIFRKGEEKYNRNKHIFCNFRERKINS